MLLFSSNDVGFGHVRRAT